MDYYFPCPPQANEDKVSWLIMETVSLQLASYRLGRRTATTKVFSLKKKEKWKETNKEEKDKEVGQKQKTWRGEENGKKKKRDTRKGRLKGRGKYNFSHQGFYGSANCDS